MNGWVVRWMMDGWITGWGIKNKRIRRKKEGENFALEMENTENNWVAASTTCKSFPWNIFK